MQIVNSRRRPSSFLVNVVSLYQKTVYPYEFVIRFDIIM